MSAADNLDLLDALEGLPGEVPPAPKWGQEVVNISPELKKRIKSNPSVKDEVAVVLGAGGAFGPDMVNALLLRGTGVVVGVDIKLTYVCKGAGYRKVDLLDRAALKKFYSDLRVWAKSKGLSLGTTYDLSTVQTSPRKEKNVVRDALEDSKGYLAEALCDCEGDARLFYMSSGEVYGAPKGAPYKEGHIKIPFNRYGRAKLLEEQRVLSYHGRKTRSGRLYVTSLRPWTIAMINYDDDGNILCSRNYNDPMMMSLFGFFDVGVKPAIINPGLKCQFHLSEEVAEVSILMGSAHLSSPVWSSPYNCIGKPSTHGKLMDESFDIFSRKGHRRVWWAFFAKLFLSHVRLPKPFFVSIAYLLQFFGRVSGLRDVGGRLPFLYRDTHMDNSLLLSVLKGRIYAHGGSSSDEAVIRLSEAIINGGPDALIFKRFKYY